MKLRTFELTAIALMTAVIVLCSQIMIPGPVPFSMQTMAVFAALRILGGAKGTASIALFLLMGGVGLPVFTGFEGGPGKLMGPTGGYLVGFLLTALIYWAFEKAADRSVIKRWIVFLFGLAVCYAAGTWWFYRGYANGRSVFTILGLCVFPFILPDLAKIAVADIAGTRIRKQLNDLRGGADPKERDEQEQGNDRKTD